MNSKNKSHHGNKWMPVLYATYYGFLKDIAERHGYALAVHGSFTRDMDLIAIPWVENPEPYIGMLKEMAKRIGWERPDGKPYDSVIEKPNGRIAFTIGTGAGGYMDISIIKPMRK